MRILTALMIIYSLGFISCQLKPMNNEANLTNNVTEVKLPVSPTPEVKETFDINLKIGIVEVKSDGASCLRTKNGNLAEKTPVSIVISLDEPPPKVLTAIINKKLETSCARYASEIGDKNPGENFYYSIMLTDVKTDEDPYYDVGFAVIHPTKPIQVQNNLVSIDLNEDGKPEFFRRCTGFEGLHFTIWTGKPLKGKRIWHSFFYLDYDTKANCKKKDWEKTEE